jgi:bifunctional DNase/RNase
VARAGIHRLVAHAIASAALAIAACASPAPVAAPVTTLPPVPSSASPPEASAALPVPTRMPADDVEVTVVGVGRTSDGAAVLLGDAAHETVLPILIGGTEALSIALRSEGRRFPRPLTHDLLDALMRELGGRILRVRIDDVRGDTFIATIFVRQADRTIELDARPSDAIALALGNGSPILVSRRLLERAGVKREDIERGGPAAGGDAGLIVP